MPRQPIDVDVSHLWWTENDGPQTYDFQSLFGNDNPVELDIGCGKGLFLFNESRARPGVNFLGVDWSRTYSRIAAARIARSSIPNVRVIAGDVWRLFPRLPDHSFHAIHAYFPDPWWKRRHRKRRLVRPDFLVQVHRLLIPSGRLCIATDVVEYFNVMLEVAATSPNLRQLPKPDPTQPLEENDYLTHFERKYRRAGRSIHRAQFEMAISTPNP